MASKEKDIRFVGKLLKLTMTGELKWKRLEIHEGGVVPRPDRYEAAVGGMKCELISFAALPVLDMAHVSVNAIANYSWDDVVLRVIDLDTNEGEVFIERDRMPIVRDLYNVVRGAGFRLDRKIDAFLKEDVTHAQ